jgi:electron transfer flavoprotein alpha subunit
MVASLYGPQDEDKTIWVFLEQRDGTLEDVSLELLSKGRELADQVNWRLVGLLLGCEVALLAQDAFALGADEILLAEHPLLANFTVDGYAQVAFQAISQYKPSAFLLGATPNSRDLAGRLAVRLRTGLNADCIDLRFDPDSSILTGEVTGFTDGVLALIETPEHRPQMATVRPGVFPASKPEPNREGKITRLPVELNPDDIQARSIDRVVGERIDLTHAEVLMIGGRGVEGDFDMLRQLAVQLNGEVGATRPPVDEGHMERERMIGQTGVICRPKVAIVCGISGAFQFLVGIQEADLVIAINSDPDAPIFSFADYCIVGDVRQIVPALIASLGMVREVSHV